MARPGITYQEVASACDQIIALNETPTINRVRDVLGTGSPNTILRHLNSWRDAAPVIERKAPELPIELQVSIVKEIERQSAESRVEVEKNFIQSQEEAKELSLTGEALESEVDRLQEENTLFSDESKKFFALAEDRKKEIAKLVIDLKNERDASESARLKLAQELNKTDSLNIKANDLLSDVSTLKSDLKRSDELKIQAEKDLAVMDAQYQSEIDKVTKAEIDLKNKDNALLKERTEAALVLTKKEDELNKEIETKSSHLEQKLSDLLKSSKASENELNNKIQSIMTKLLESQTNASVMQGRLTEIDKLTKPAK